MLDQAQDVQQETGILEINGKLFPLLDFKMEEFPEDNLVIRHALLRISEKQFLELNTVLDNDIVRSKREEKKKRKHYSLN